MNLVNPKVSVICVCFNHQRFVEESIQSVLGQSYKNFEIVVVDDGSSDQSPAVIEKIIGEHPEVTFIRLEKNQGVCKAFNAGLKFISGDFIIDLAADDVLCPDRLEKGVKLFQNLSINCGVIFSDAEWVDETGKHLYFHSEKFPHQTIPQGDFYRHLIESYFICSPTMMFKREVMENLNGYDETLSYEDFDFWIRSSRRFNYFYDRDVSVKKKKNKEFALTAAV